MTNQSLSPFSHQLDTAQYRWFAVTTLHRHEKRVLNALEQQSIETYLPLLRKTCVYPSKTRITMLPLINRYVFVRIVQADYVQVLQTAGVLGFVRFGDQAIAIPESEIQLLRRIVGDDTELDWELKQWQPCCGDQVEVIAGHLTGLRGHISEDHNGTFFVVDVASIGMQLQVNRSYLTLVQSA